LLALQSQVIGLCHTVDGIQEQHRVEGHKEFQMMNANLCQVLIKILV
jgi:hypothetical protein